MRVSPVRLLGILAFTALGTATVAWTRPAPDVTHERRAVEIQRIRMHFDSVLVELGARPTTALATAQRANRTALRETLQGYRDRGVFPHNYDFPGRAVPYFVDRKTGTLCAVGFLLASTGRTDIVDRVAGLNNNVYVAQLAGDTAFTGWLTKHGITLEEAARIQVPYWGDVAPPPTQTAQSNATAYKVGSAAAIGGALFATAWNARSNRDGSSRLANALGATVGVAAIGLGAASMGYSDAPPALAAANVIAGAASTWASTRGFLRHRRVVAAAREAARVRESAAVSVAPMVVPNSSGAGAGVSVSVRF
jgi:hypothetical protein